MSSRTNFECLSYKSGSQKYVIHKKVNETLEKCVFLVIGNTVEKELHLPLYVQKILILMNGLLFMVFSHFCFLNLVLDFYNDINLIFSVVQDECTTYSCPIMSAGSK